MVRLKTSEYLIHCIMSDPYKPIERIPPTDEVSRVQRIESYKQDKRDQKEPSPKKNLPILHSLPLSLTNSFHYFKKRAQKLLSEKN